METSPIGVNISHQMTGRYLQVEIITVAFTFMYPVQLGSLPYVGPAFDSAREDIRKLYPKINISQAFVLDRNIRGGCPEWLTVYENLLAAFYYSPRRSVDLIVFVMSGEFLSVN
jgi:hypothetical protein